MRSFTQYLTEDKDRFIKKNKNLTDEQKEEIIKFFKMNRQAEGKINWQKAKDLTYDDFVNVMITSRSGRKAKLKHQKISGAKEGEDYIRVRMKNKDYLAYIPLNYETAQKFNTREMGVCSGDWCIGSSLSPQEWNGHIIHNQEVPIYLINTDSKWVLMIQEGNKKVEYWDIDNVFSKRHMGVPNFSTRKELLTPQLKALYDDIRENHFQDEVESEEIDVIGATVDYDDLVEDINNSKDARESAEEYAREQFYEEAARVKSETKDEYENEIESLELEFQVAAENFDQAEEAQIQFTGADDEEYIHFDGEDVTEDELQDRVDALEKIKDVAEKNLDDANDILNSIDDVIDYEMYNHDEIQWSEDPPNEDYIYDDLDIDIPSVSDSKYSDYIDIMEEHAGFSLRHSGQSVDSDILEYSYGNLRANSAEEVLSNHELFHPDWINERNQ